MADDTTCLVRVYFILSSSSSSALVVPNEQVWSANMMDVWHLLLQVGG